MRVVHVSLVRPRGRPEPEALLAAWPTLHDIAAAVRCAGAEVSVVQSFHQVAELKLDGVHYRFAPEPALPGRPTGVSPWAVAAAVKAFRPDIIHVNGLEFGWHTRVLCGLGAPVLVQDHASRAEGGGLRRRWGLRNISAVAFTDARQAEPFLAKAHLRRGLPVFSVPESSTRFAPGDQAAARQACGLDGDPAVLWVGRLTSNKDPLTVLGAIELAAQDLPGLRFWCCHQEDDLLPQVRARIAASPILAERVRLLGRVTHREVETLCRAADLFMLASHAEGSGYALMEALACGATPLVSDIPSFRRLTGDGRVGALAPVENIEAFARALVRLAQAPRAEARRRTIEHFERDLSFDAVGAQLVQAYRDVIARAR
ncbi:MAG TPA: glycosyltransferase family 4 protein [Caulobacteraceae bacterium]|jgi:glycosyltransferase involved in cell wall biosynthesis